VIVKVWVCPEFEDVCLEIPPDGGLSTSVRDMLTLWVWPASDEETKVWDVLSDGPDGEPFPPPEQLLWVRAAQPKNPPAMADDLRKSRLFM